MPDPVIVVPAPSPAPVIPTDWRAGLTGEYAPLAQERSLEAFKGQDWAEVGPTLAKAFVETKKLVGAKPSAVTIPGEGATPEVIAAYRQAIGVPDTPEGYRIVRPAAALDGMWDVAAETALLGKLHAVGTPPPVVQAIMTWYGDFLTEQQTLFRREAEAASQALRRDWGPNYDANVGRANRAIQQYGGDALVDLFAQNGMGRHPLVVATFAKIGTDLVEHGAMTGEVVTAVTPEEAQERVKSLQAELLTVPHGSDRAKALIEQIVTYSKVAARPRTT